MNERIKELAKQAVLQTNEVFDQNGKDYSEIVMEKFAELIVRECADMVMNDENAFDIMKHFGVE
jgi:hypothetical protein